MTPPRPSRTPGAPERSPAEQAADLLSPGKVLGGLLALLVPEAGPDAGPDDAVDLDVVDRAAPRGVERPDLADRAEGSLAVDRAFAFVDVCGFTSFCDRHGEHAAVELLTRFRSLAREITGRRGARISKWLGDGLMIVSTQPGPLIAAVAELVARCDAAGIPTHAGIAAGPVLIFEGDDYIGRPANLAARLMEDAGSGEILAEGLAEHRPEWVVVDGRVSVRVAGIGDVSGVVRLRADRATTELLRSEPPAA